MNITDKTIWQHAAGDNDRNYVELCLRWDVILSGPGYRNRWPGCEAALRKDQWTAKKMSVLRRFAEEMKDGDLVVLRVGTSKVYGVGEIVGQYDWSDDFGDVDGWDLQHLRRVRWLWRSDQGPETFDQYALKWGDTTQRLRSGPVIDWLKELELLPEALSLPLVPLPKQNILNSISLDAISERLFDHGVGSTSIKTLLGEIGELIRIAKWYRRSPQNNPSEHETVAYLVVPLLRSLGWSPQLMAVEWNRVDVALFARLPRDNEHLCIVVEAKKMGKSCLSAKSQALSYATGKTNCTRLFVTDGIRYGVYIRSKDGFALYAYLNLTRLMRDYPVLECRGADAALLAMTPEWRPEGTI